MTVRAELVEAEMRVALRASAYQVSGGFDKLSPSGL
jgi:hypothetical protein